MIGYNEYLMAGLPPEWSIKTPPCLGVFQERKAQPGERV